MPLTRWITTKPAVWTALHLKYASHKLFPLLSMRFNGCLVHGTLPNAIMSVMLVPLHKDKAGKLNSIDQYRPVALASILSKVLEKILLMSLLLTISLGSN